MDRSDRRRRVGMPEGSSIPAVDTKLSQVDLDPYGEDWDFDLIVCRAGALERVQVKHAVSRDGLIVVKCRSHSLTNGKVRRVKRYTSELVDWIAIWDSTTNRCFYVPAKELGSGKWVLHLRLTPARNGQVARTRNAEDYSDLTAERGASR
jgi:hypothetical protein